MRNKRMIKLSKKAGYELIEFRIRHQHNSVLMVKWLKERPYSHLHCLLKFMRIKYKKKYLHWLDNLKK